MPKYIDADALLAEAKRISGPFTGDGWSNFGVYALIERQPAADVAGVRHGRWIDAYPQKEQNPMFNYGTCSVCGFEQGISNKLNFCPNCGADLREDKDG